MVILGITMGINSSCCLMINGKIVAAQQEERYRRIKNYDTWPGLAIKSCLKIGNLKPNQIDKVIWAGKDPIFLDYFLTKRYSSLSNRDMITEQHVYWYKKLYENKKINYLKIFKNKIDLKQAPGKKILQKYLRIKSNKEKKLFSKEFKKLLIEKELGLTSKKLECIEHHECHGYYSICNEKKINNNKLVFTVDGSGDRGINATISIIQNKKLKRLFETKNLIIGRIYRHITLILGMKWGEHEYKTMGLAPYSSQYYSDGPFKIFSESLNLKLKKKIIISKKIKDCYFSFIKELSFYRFDGIAQGVQRFAEQKLLEWFNYWIKKTKIKNIFYSGGVSMNVKVNKEISSIKNIKSLVINGSGSDETLSIGACYAYCIKNNLNYQPLKNLYLGFRENKKNILSVLKTINKKKYSIRENPNNSYIAKLISSGLILGRCKGNMEFGARALGNRTIMADPRSFSTIEKINRKIKSRDFWMPFAPSVNEEYASKYFYLKKGVDYTQMTVCVDSKEEYRKKISAVLHPSDYTARIHLVKKKNNTSYHDLIQKFYEKTNIGLILNTSLNLHGKPIARDIHDCMEILEKSDIDGIQIEDFLILKKNVKF